MAIRPDPLERELLERRLDEERYVAREKNNGATGLLIGVTLAALVGLAGAAFYFMGDRQESPTQILPLPVPNNSQPQSQPQKSNNDTTIIDRTIEKTKEVVPVPQQQAPASQQKAPEAPDININVPSPQQQAPDASTSSDSPDSPPSQGASQDNPSSQP